MQSRHWWSLVETGSVVELWHTTSGLRFRALVEKKSDGAWTSANAAPTIALGNLEHPFEKLRIALNGHVGWAIAAAKFAAFQVEEATASEAEALSCHREGHSLVDDAAAVYLKAVAHQKKPNRGGGMGWFLGVAMPRHEEADGTSGAQRKEVPTVGDLIGDAARDSSSLFMISLVSRRGAFALDQERTLFQGSFGGRASSILSESQRHAFMRDGFLQLRDVVPMRLINAALRRINHELGQPGRMVDGGVEGAAKLAGNVSNSDAILDLYHRSDASAYVDALVGMGCVDPPRGAQIAMRFPELGEPRDPTGTEWHTDGMRQGRRHPFSLLLGVALSDVREPLAGNLTVFPGSHHTLHPLMQADGTLTGVKDECYKADSVWGDGTLPDLGMPLQLRASRGDIVLAHPNLAHRGGLNFSPDIRYQIYFRIKHRDHASIQELAGSDLWADLEGLHHLRDRGAADESPVACRE